MMEFIKDPKFFSYILLVLYFMNTIRWAYEKDFGQFLYWVGALLITYAVTFLFKV